MMKYHTSKVCLAFMYKQHTHMVYGELHILPYLVLDRNANDNAYSSPLVDVSVVFMDPYLPDSTNDAILSLIPSRTTW